MICRSCKNNNLKEFIDLGYSPISNAYLDSKIKLKSEKKYPLRVLFCENCWLVQTDDKVELNMIFNRDYAYFSSYSSSWLKHSKDFTEMISSRLNLNEKSQVVEIASNDGYLLQFFKKMNIPCYGIEPTESTAIESKKKGIEVIIDFLTTNLAKEIKSKDKCADLMIANNVLAHVPDINDFIKSFYLIMKPSGIATFEFPHLINLIEKNQFDTIYHEHYSYLSLIAVENIFTKNGLQIFDVEELPTHGGSLRVYAQRKDTGIRKIENAVRKMIDYEIKYGIQNSDTYLNYKVKVNKVKNDLQVFLNSVIENNEKIIAYGAAAKGNTLLNYMNIKNEIIKYVVDSNKYKQGKFLPGSGIKVVDQEIIEEIKPNYILILPWNLKDEIISSLTYVREWNCKFVTAIPTLQII